jgi:hypothetical protein
MTAGKALSDKDMNGRQVTNLGTPSNTTDAATKTYVDTISTSDRSRANHTGTQLASTISDFDTQVRTSRLDQMAAPTGSVGLNSQKLTSVLDPTSAQDGATKNYVDNSLAGVSGGLTIKGTVRAATSTNITIATPGTTIDGLTAANGDIFLLMGQSTGSQNGPYVFNGSATAMTRATNFSTTAQATLGSFWIVREGTNADTLAVLTNDTAITIGTTTPTFVIRGTSTPTTGYTTTNPTTSAGGTWLVTHNLATKFLVAQVARTASPYDFVDVRIERTTTNTLSIMPDVALTAGDYEVMVKAI